jgi:hypothetical protein
LSVRRIESDNVAQYNTPTGVDGIGREFILIGKATRLDERKGIRTLKTDMICLHERVWVNKSS